MDTVDRRLVWAIRLIIIPGLVAATYLTYSKVFDQPLYCTEGCGKVNSSRWSEILGIPVTLVGMVTYLLLMASTFVRSDVGKIGGAFLATVGAAFSIFLQYQALVVLGLTCPWCLTSAACMIILCVLTVFRLVRLPQAPGDGSTVSA